MNDDNLVTLSFKVPSDAVAIIDSSAEKAGMNRSEYLRSRALSDTAIGEDENITALLRHIVYILARLHNGMYMIPERQGALSTNSLEEIYAETARHAGTYLRELDERISKLNKQLCLEETAGELAGK